MNDGTCRNAYNSNFTLKTARSNTMRTNEQSGKNKEDKQTNAAGLIINMEDEIDTSSVRFFYD